MPDKPLRLSEAKRLHLHVTLGCRAANQEVTVKKEFTVVTNSVIVG